MGEKLAAALHGCKGQCCRNPLGTCYHQRKCDHHADELLANRSADYRKIRKDNRRKSGRGNL